MVLDKTSLRKHCLQARSVLTPEQRQQAESHIMRHVSDMLAGKGGIIALYMPIRGEVSPLSLPNLLPDATFAMPCIEGNDMWFTHWHPEMAMKEGHFGILQPTDVKSVVPDIVITPLLGFDAGGHRLGYGKGYYDRYFSAREREAIMQQRIGIAFACQQVEAIPAEGHDIRLHHIITEQGRINTL